MFTISVPVLYLLAGLWPSKPNWNGTTNFLCCTAEFDNDILVDAFANVEPNVLASALPVKSSSDIVTLLPLPEPTGIGAKYCTLSSAISSVIKSTPKATLESNVPLLSVWSDLNWAAGIVVVPGTGFLNLSCPIGTTPLDEPTNLPSLIIKPSPS